MILFNIIIIIALNGEEIITYYYTAEYTTLSNNFVITFHTAQKNLINRLDLLYQLISKRNSL